MPEAQLDKYPGCQRLHAKLGVVSDVADVAIVVAFEVCVFFEAVDGGEADYALVGGLEEVDRAEEGEHVDVCFSEDSFAVGFAADVGGVEVGGFALFEGDGVDVLCGGSFRGRGLFVVGGCHGRNDKTRTRGSGVVQWEGKDLG